MSSNGRSAWRLRHDPPRERLVAAMIALAGTRGYEETSIDLVCERAETRRSHFDRCFAGREDCFLTVHDEVTAEFCERIHAACAGASCWHDRVWAAGWAATRFFEEDPVRARFLVVEVNGSGTGAQERRDRTLQGLADILDGGREEVEKPSVITRATAEIMAGAIYGTVLERIECGYLDRGQDFLPELVYMAVLPYFGVDAAEDELLVQPLRVV